MSKFRQFAFHDVSLIAYIYVSDSSPITRFVLCIHRGCDSCEEWYHGDCINVTEKDAKYIKQFFCVVSRIINKTVVIINIVN